MLGQRRDTKGKHVHDISKYFLFFHVVEKAWSDLTYLMQCTSSINSLVNANPKDHKINLNTLQISHLTHPIPHSAC
jgi:hypothetical protein